MQDKILKELPGVQKNIILKSYTTYKIGGPARYFFIAKSKDGLIDALKTAKKFKIPVFILGGGSNLLVSDKGFNGLVIKINITDVEFSGDSAVVGAGANLTKLAYESADAGLSGLEWSAGVPGTVGGAIYGNAQAFGKKICQAIKSVEAVNAKTFEVKSLTNEQCQFSLKKSVFKKNKNLVILSVRLKFRKGDTKIMREKIKEFLHYRKSHHPMNFPSAGSTFVNPEIRIKNKNLLEKFPELNGYNEKGIIPVGYLIAKSGLVGKKIGEAQISEKHANFIINLGGAKAKDIIVLMNSARKEVKKIFNITLIPEVQFVGFNSKVI